MRANLQELAKAMRPISDERARELRLGAEQSAGECPPRFVAAENELHDEYWERAVSLDPMLSSQQATA